MGRPKLPRPRQPTFTLAELVAAVGFEPAALACKVCGSSSATTRGSPELHLRLTEILPGTGEPECRRPKLRPAPYTRPL
jgi:hypothetical protein